jgi:hypothetical protein
MISRFGCNPGVKQAAIQTSETALAMPTFELHPAMKRNIVAILMLAGFAALAQQAPKVKKTPPVPPPLPPMAHALEDALGGLAFSMPVAVVSAPGEVDRLFVVEKTGLHPARDESGSGNADETGLRQSH